MPGIPPFARIKPEVVGACLPQARLVGRRRGRVIDGARVSCGHARPCVHDACRPGHPPPAPAASATGDATFAAPNDSVSCRFLTPVPRVYVGVNCEWCVQGSTGTCTQYDHYCRVVCIYVDGSGWYCSI